MKAGFRQSMAWLHTWTGLLVGWLLLMVFMAGTASYYRAEISRWMRPELPKVEVTRAVAAERAVEYLQREAPRAELWNVTLPDARNPVLRMFWRNPLPADGAPLARGERFGSVQLDPRTGTEIVARDTRGGDFFYRLHFDLHYLPPIWARLIVGFCAMFMLVAIITGVITHKKIFKDFFTFRPGKGLRSWLDFHNASAVMALPYHAMITYTGIVTLMFLYLPWGVDARYGDDQDAFFAEAFGGMAEVREASATPAAPYPIATLIDRARQHWDGAGAGGFVVHHPGDANAVVDVHQHGDNRLSIETPTLRFDGVSGAVLSASPDPGAASQTRGVMYGLHLGRFAGPGLRFLFFLSGLAGCLMVASGVIMWAVKERPKHLKAGHAKAGAPGFGLRLVDALNIGAVAGLPIAFASFFWANRLLPLDVVERAEAEIDLFFVAWLLSLAAAFAWPRRAMWAWQLYVGAALFGLLPVLNALTTDAHLGVTLRNGDWALAGVDLTVFAIGLLLACGARRMQRPLAPPARQRRGAVANPSGLASEGAEA
ncbi:MAG: PepSY domain-containing protein [Lysobacter sp.]